MTKIKFIELTPSVNGRHYNIDDFILKCNSRKLLVDLYPNISNLNLRNVVAKCNNVYVEDGILYGDITTTIGYREMFAEGEDLFRLYPSTIGYPSSKGIVQLKDVLKLSIGPTQTNLIKITGEILKYNYSREIFKCGDIISIQNSKLFSFSRNIGRKKVNVTYI